MNFFSFLHIFKNKERKTSSLDQEIREMEEKLRILREKREAERSKLSDEQMEVVETVLQNKNVIVNAKAGAGKTTVSIEVGKRFYEKHHREVLLLTYNKRLKKETQKRIKEEGLEGKIYATNYHGAASKFFLKNKKKASAADDQLIIQAIEIENVQPLNFGLVVVDEMQDMTALYCTFVQHLLSKCSTKPVMLAMGDPFQQIYRHLGTSNEYLMNAGKYFEEYLEMRQFVNLSMSICWRITKDMANFI